MTFFNVRLTLQSSALEELQKDESCSTSRPLPGSPASEENALQDVNSIQASHPESECSSMTVDKEEPFRPPCSQLRSELTVSSQSGTSKEFSLASVREWSDLGSPRSPDHNDSPNPRDSLGSPDHHNSPGSRNPRDSPGSPDPRDSPDPHDSRGSPDSDTSDSSGSDWQEGRTPGENSDASAPSSSDHGPSDNASDAPSPSAPSENDGDRDRRSYPALRDLLAKSFGDPLNLNSNSSPVDLLYMIVGLAIRHNFSNQALLDTVNLVNAIFPSAVIPSTRYLIDRLLVSHDHETRA